MVVGGGWGGVCKVISMSNPTVVLRLGWGFDNFCHSSFSVKWSMELTVSRHVYGNIYSPYTSLLGALRVAFFNKLSLLYKL